MAERGGNRENNRFGFRRFLICGLQVRQQVDLANTVQPNRHGCPTDTKCRGSPAGRATNKKTAFMPCFFVCRQRTRTDQSCEATTGSTTSRFGKHSAAKSSRLPHRHKVSRESCWARHKLKKTKFDLLFFCPIIHRTINTKKKQKAQL